MDLVWRGHLLGKKNEECISFWENRDLPSKQRVTSKQQLQNSYFWAVLAFGLPNAKGQLQGMLMKANHQNRE